MMHFKCYQSYLEKLIKEETETPTMEGINLEKGEFVCPLCKSIGSAVAPFYPNHSSNKEETKLLSFSEWFSSFSQRSLDKIKIFSPISSDSEWSLSYDLFLQYFHLNQCELWPHPSAPIESCLTVLWNSVK